MFPRTEVRKKEIDKKYLHNYFHLMPPPKYPDYIFIYVALDGNFFSKLMLNENFWK